MKPLKILLVLLVLCFTFSGVASFSSNSTPSTEDIQKPNKHEVKIMAESLLIKRKKPTNA